MFIVRFCLPFPRQALWLVLFAKQYQHFQLQPNWLGYFVIWVPVVDPIHSFNLLRSYFEWIFAWQASSVWSLSGFVCFDGIAFTSEETWLNLDAENYENLCHSKCAFPRSGFDLASKRLWHDVGEVIQLNSTSVSIDTEVLMRMSSASTAALLLPTTLNFLRFLEQKFICPVDPLLPCRSRQ